MKTRKFLSVLLALAMAITTMAVFAVSASAADLFESTAVKSGKTTSFMLKDMEELSDFKFVATEAGTLKISLRTDIEVTRILVFNSNGTLQKPTKYKATSGEITWNEQDSKENMLRCKWQESTKLFLGTATYKVNKGKYYIRIQRGSRSSFIGDYNCEGAGNVKLTATYPSDGGSDGSSSGVSITNFALTMKVGDTIQLDADLSAKSDDNVAWKSDKTSVAKVSATGKITAQAKGTATITATIGGSSMKIKVKVSG